ncbi:MAG: hypothetical protein F4151_15220 [Gammaproteobacteria bacterium]|nr:hypothetical protein [Gammaproteobacteria bacterium]
MTDILDATGAVATPGSYAFLGEDELGALRPVTAYEEPRDGSTTVLRIHESDADGGSRAATLDGVRAGDLVEWHAAPNCFVRYRITEVSPEPPGTTSAREFGVEWMTYAFTGCSGDIGPDVTASFRWDARPDLGGAGLTAPVVHGIYQILPAGWTGATAEPGLDFSGPRQPEEFRSYETLAEARRLPYWRDPALPEGWILEAAWIGFEGPRYGYCATFRTEERPWRDGETYRDYAFDLCGLSITGWHHPEEASWLDGAGARETRVVAGRPAVVSFSPEGPDSDPGFPISIRVYDPETRAEYELLAADWSIRGSHLEAALSIVRSLFDGEPSYEIDTTGAVTRAGSHSFLREAGDGTAAPVTTYEGLRDGSATILRIHKTHASGASRTAILDNVGAGDLVEWNASPGCFVRYRITEVRAGPPGTAFTAEFGVESIAYSFTGCSGEIAPDVSATLRWGELPNLGGTSLTAPIVQGPFQLVPAGWTGATKPVGPRVPARPTVPFAEATSLAEARTFPHWREPDLPQGWTFTYAVSGDEADAGYFEAFYDGFRLVISASGINSKYSAKEATATYDNGSQTSVRETLQIAGRPARVHYSITDRQFRVTVHVWDEATGVLYMLRGSPDMATLIAFAESMFSMADP